MEFLYNLTQIIAVQVSIYFRSSNRFVAQHLLNSAQIGTAFYQMRSK